MSSFIEECAKIEQQLRDAGATDTTISTVMDPVEEECGDPWLQVANHISAEVSYLRGLADAIEVNVP